VPGKRCSKCGEFRALSEFYAARGGRDGLRGDCKRCFKERAAAAYAVNPEPARERARRWNRENPERYAANLRAYKESGKKKFADRKSHLKRKFGLTVDDYEQMLAAQGGGCAICGRPPRGDIALHVDHDHDTGAVRGLLCFRCNNALGDFDSDPALLRAAIDYLEALMPASG
jgi:Recombination endonuclease VII